MKKIKKRILAAALAAAMLLTAPGAVPYASAEGVQTDSSIAKAVEQTEDEDTEKSDAESSSTKKPETGESTLEEEETETAGMTELDTEDGDTPESDIEDNGLCRIEDLIAELPDEVTGDNAAAVTVAYEIYVQVPDSWTDVYCYAYSEPEEGDKIENAGWPGESMSKLSEGYWTYCIPETLAGQQIQLIFSDKEHEVNRFPADMMPGLQCDSEGTWLFMYSGSGQNYTWVKHDEQHHFYIDAECGVCGAKPVAKVEKDGKVIAYVGENNFADAFTSANSGAKVTLMDHVKISSMVFISKNTFTLDLAGYDITSSDEAAINTMNADLTITGNGCVTANTVPLSVTGGTVNLQGGWFHTNGMESVGITGATLYVTGENVKLTGGNGLNVTGQGSTVKLCAGTYSSINTDSMTIGDLLGHTDTTRYAYYDESGLIIGKLEEKSLSGTITVKECTHESREVTPIGNGTHSTVCYACEAEAEETCDYNLQTEEDYAKTCECGSTLKVTLSDAQSLVYNGTEHKPGVTVTVDDEIMPEESAYTVSYSDNKNAGDASVTVTMDESAGTGTVSVGFSIGKATPELTWTKDAARTLTYTGQPADITGLMTVTLVNDEEFDGTVIYSYTVSDSNSGSTDSSLYAASASYSGGTDLSVHAINGFVKSVFNLASNVKAYLSTGGINTNNANIDKNDIHVNGGTYIVNTAGTGADLYADGLPTNAGTYSIKAAIAEQDNYTAAESVDTLSLTINKANGTLTISQTEISKKAGDAEFSLDCTVEGDGEISYSSDNEDVAVVSSDGTVQIKGCGTAEITVSLAEGTNYTAAIQTVVITVQKNENPPKMPGSVMDVPDSYDKVGDVPLPENWEWQEEDKDKALKDETAVEAVAVYTGTDRDNYENITVTVAVTSHIAGEDVLYTGIGEKEPTCTEAGLGHRECVICHAVIESDIVTEALGHDYESVVTKEPTASEEGERTYTCLRCSDTYTETIFKKGDLSKATVTLTDAGSLVYNGRAHKPTPAVLLDGEELVENIDYTVVYTDNVNAGTASAVIVGAGDYQGTVEKSFSIAKAVPNITWNVEQQELTYSGSAAAIAAPDVTLANNEIYEGVISYSYAADSADADSRTDGLPVNAGTYTVRACIAEQDNYTAAESRDTLALIIHKAEGVLTIPETKISRKLGDGEFSLNCSADGDGEISYRSDHEDVAVVSQDGKVLVKGLGTATITVSLAEGSNYTGTDDQTITIIVQRGENAPDMPDSVMHVPDRCVKIGDVLLPDNWEWQEEDRDKALEDETEVYAVAVYTGADRDNYENITVTVAVKSHVTGDEIFYTGAGEKEPTCMETGLGHSECVNCHTVVESGIMTAALRHDYKEVVTKEPTTSEEGEGTYTCSRCGDTYTETIPKEIPTGLWIGGMTKSVTYTGTAVKQENIRVYHGSTLLREKTEYTITYKNNTSAGTAQVIVTGKGNYKGKCTAEFTIEPIGLGTGTTGIDNGISATIATATETGKKLKPAVTVTWNGKKLKEKKDYTLSYASDIKTASGEGYDVTIIGKGNYTGSLVKKFYVKAKGTLLLNKATVKGIKKSYEYRSGEQDETPEEQNTAPEGQDATPEEQNTISEEQNGQRVVLPKGLESDLENIIIKVGGKTLTAGTDYTVRTENTAAVGMGYVVIEAAPGSDYAGEKRISFNITGTSLKKYSIAGLQKSYPYTGEPIMPEIEVYSGKNGTGTQIFSDAYTVQYSNYMNQGKATVTVTGIPEKGFSGSIKATYTIGKMNLAANLVTEGNTDGIRVTMPEDIKYAKGGTKPQPVVTHIYNGTVRTLREGVDYTLKYSNNTARYTTASTGDTSARSAKKPTLKITGVGNYTGTITKNYDIGAQDIEQLEITVTDKAYNSKKKGSYYYSAPKVYDFDGKQLKSGKDYAVAYTYATGDDRDGQPIGKTDPVENGTKIRVTVTAKDTGSYTGTLSAIYFVRDAKEVKDIAKTKNDKMVSWQYTGSEVKPEVRLYTMTGKTKNYLSEDDYEIIGYYNNIKRGTATILIRGTSSYSGVKSITFKITSADNKSIWSGIF